MGFRNVFVLALALVSPCVDNCCVDNSLPGCPGAPPADGFGTPTISVTFDSLATKTMPVRLDDDGNTKDVSVKDRAGFKPSKGDEAGLAKRLRMKSKVDGGQACLVSRNTLTGEVSSRVRVAIDSIAGLVDGSSLAFLERRPVGEGPVVRVEAVWSAGLDGFTARALVDGVPTGDTLVLPGAQEVELYLLDLGTGFALQAAAPEGVGETLAFSDKSGADDTATFAIGAAGLGKQGAFWFAQARFDFGTQVNLGSPETVATAYLVVARSSLDDAIFLLTEPQTGPIAQGVHADLIAAEDLVGPALQAIQAAVDNGSLAAGTNGAQLLGQLKAILSTLLPAQAKLFGLLQKGGTSALSVKSAVSKAYDSVELAIAIAQGFQSKSHAKLAQSVHVTIG